jgi:hypothetical protein
MDSASAQLISSFGSNKLNELRFQFARRHQSRTASDGSGTGPAIAISGIAFFGGPVATVSDAGFDFSQKIWQVLDNFTVLRGRHSFKAGFDLQYVTTSGRNNLFQLYTLPHHRRLPERQERRDPAELLDVPAARRRPRGLLQLDRSCPSSCRTTCA